MVKLPRFRYAGFEFLQILNLSYCSKIRTYQKAIKADFTFKNIHSHKQSIFFMRDNPLIKRNNENNN